jgi:LmbE family N-acetylglucosaminyl deacetylase
MRRVLVIAAHPDDEVLGCGATISKYSRQGVQFMVLFIAEGSSCRYADPVCSESVAAIAARTQQAVNALYLLGVKDYHFNDLPCGRLDQVPIIEINKVIEQSIRKFDPDTVLTHSAFDANNDHRIVFRATIMATRPGTQNRVARLLSYEVLSSSEWAFGEAFTPTSFEQIEEQDLANKWKALSAYETEVKAFPFPRSEKGVRAQAMSRGMQIGVSLAEAFYLIREFRI